MSRRVSLGRFGVIAFGYSVASVAAGLAMSAAVAVMAMAGSSFKDFADIIGASMTVAAIIIAVTFLLALLPATAFILYAKRHGVRSPVAYAAMGAAASIALPACVAAYSLVMKASLGTGMWGPGFATMSYLGLIAGFYILPGICGGLAYWAVAGRTAGSRGKTGEPLAKPG